MASKSIDIIISTILKKTGIDAARAQMANLAKTVGKNLTNIKSAFDMAATAMRTFVSAMSKGMEFERMTVQFKSLTGSMEMAKTHMRDLQDLGRTPPFSLEEFAAASQAMMKMTGGMAGFKKEMEIVGDLAAATGNDIATVGRSFGLAYQVIRDGQDFGRAGQQLYSLGIMTKKQVAEFAELSKAGTDNAAVWEKLQEVFGRYHGAMAETEKTTKGLVEAIQGEATVALTEFSAALGDAVAPELGGILGYLKQINEDGTIEDWASRSASALESLIDTVKGLCSVFGGAWKTIQSVIGTPLAFAAGVAPTLFTGQGIGSQLKAGWDTVANFNRGVWGIETDEERSRRESAKADVAAEKKRKREEQSAKLAAESEKRIADDMARAQEETDRKRAEEKAKAEAEAAKKAESERLKVVEAERKAREKMEADLHRQRVENAKAEVQASNDAAQSKQNAINSAQTEFDRAFAMYRSEDKGAATIAEERAYAADYKRLQKDAARYGGKWRIDELSSLIAAGDTAGQAAKLEEWRKSSRFTPEVESMVRAAAADQTKTTAEDELRKINANTANLDKKLDELLSMK